LIYPEGAVVVSRVLPVVDGGPCWLRGFTECKGRTGKGPDHVAVRALLLR